MNKVMKKKDETAKFFRVYLFRPDLRDGIPGFRIATSPKPVGPRIVLSDTSCEFRIQSIAKKSLSNFGDSERFAYLCVRKITTNENTHKYSLT